MSLQMTKTIKRLLAAAVYGFYRYRLPKERSTTFGREKWAHRIRLQASYAMPEEM